MNREYSAELKKIEAYLVETLPLPISADWCNRVFPGLGLNADLAENLIAPCRDLFGRGGKRWRPLLAHLVCKALGGGDAALPLLPLVEYCHNASLIHDDLEDNSEERRGKPAVHLLYGNDTAINSGSFLYFLPLFALENWEAAPEDKNRLWKLWGEHMRALHLGQSMDIAWHRDISSVPSIDEYMMMCSLKTGCLAKFAALLGVEAALGNNDEMKTLLGGAAQKLGVGFQILDDVKNLKAGIPGKKRGDDVVEGKKSLPVLIFLHDTCQAAGSRAGGEESIAFVRRCFKAAALGGTEVPELDEFIAALTESGSLEKAEQRGNALIAEAGKVFAGLETADAEAGRLLAGLTELLLYA